MSQLLTWFAWARVAPASPCRTYRTCRAWRGTWHPWAPWRSLPPSSWTGIGPRIVYILYDCFNASLANLSWVCVKNEKSPFPLRWHIFPNSPKYPGGDEVLPVKCLIGLISIYFSILCFLDSPFCPCVWASFLVITFNNNSVYVRWRKKWIEKVGIGLHIHYLYIHLKYHSPFGWWCSRGAW